MQTVPSSMYLLSQCKSIKYSTRSPYPQSRDKHACCLHDNQVYMYAGRDRNISLRDFWKFHLGTLKWEKVSFRGDVPQHLEGHTLVSSKKLMLLFGGEFGDANTESSLWILNPDLNFVRKIVLDSGSPCPSVRRQHSAVVYQGSMFVYGGYVDVQGTSSQLWRYQIDDEEWELLPQGRQSCDGPGGRYGHSAIVYNKHMWLYGGMSDLQAKQDLWRYSFTSGKWERIKSKYSPPPLTGHSAVVAGSTMILFGGESSREPVNQLWCFCFKTEKWTQVIPKDVIPSGRTGHAALFVSPSKMQDDSVKASSMPYLQKKVQKMNLGPRPKSSCGVRTRQPNEGIVNSAFERSISSESASRPRSLNGDKSFNEDKQSVNTRNSVSVESLKIVPSPSENAKDESPLCPSSTDYNYNISEMLNKNAVVTTGIDNPGISKSTEELIEEDHVRKMMAAGDGVGIAENHSSLFRDGSIQSSSNFKRFHTFQRQNTDSLLTNCSNHHSIGLSNQLSLRHSKKCRLNLEQVQDGIDNLDGLPNQVVILNPSRYISTTSPDYIQKTPFTHMDVDGLETIILDDRLPKTHSMSANEDTFPALDPCKTVRYNREEEKVYFSETQRQSKLTQVSSLESHNNNQEESEDTLEDYKVAQEMETCFQPQNQETDWSQNGRYAKNPSVKKIKAASKAEAPYMLVLGGKDTDSSPFAGKPIPMWKFHLMHAAV